MKTHIFVSEAPAIGGIYISVTPNFMEPNAVTVARIWPANEARELRDQLDAALARLDEAEAKVEVA